MSKRKLNSRLLSDVKPLDKAFEIYDTDLPGFVLRVQPSGLMTYYLRYRRPDGRQTRVKLGSHPGITIAQARALAQKTLASVYNGEDPAKEKQAARQHTLRAFLEKEYKPLVLDHRPRAGEVHDRIVRAADGLLDRKLHEITVWDIEKRRRSRLKEGLSPATLNRDTGALKAALERAVEWGFIAANPLAKLKPLKETDRGKVRYLEPEETQRLMAALDSREERMRTERERHNGWCKDRGYEEWPDLRKLPFADHLKPMVLLSLNTGMRRGELFSLEWQDVDMKARMLTIRGTTAKSGKTRHIPLNETSFSLLQDWHRQTSGTGLVFKSPKTGKRFGHITTSWHKLCDDAKVKNFRWHDMRHDFASRLVMAGVDLNTVRELLGHSDIKMTLRYAHLAPEHKAQAVAKLDRAGGVTSLAQGTVSS